MAEDRFANIATFQVTESGANTLTFVELLTNAGIDADRNKATALLIDQIDYLPNGATAALMTSAGDTYQYGLTISNGVTNLIDPTDRRILHSGYVQRNDFGTAASAALMLYPHSYQFFPPLITAERRIYLGTTGTGLASATTMNARMYYRTETLTQAEFIELSEVFSLVG